MKWPASNDYSLQTDDGTVTQTSWQLVTVTTLTEGGGDRRMKIYIEDEMKKETFIPLTD